ncbi:MAG: IS66 family transposase [Bryobacterales bacterium]|nr:IS66 family transposase [Bryobacterales bacterium]MCZ2147417.1 IS66 family transposase [Bryobacterales bacterium]MCZ2150387.1 IS66 family transposase [Bryobacterales bacterium]MCZ2150652.1 IS66 family transposase [Bryobacterales bacterium]MCZ2151733.1 IS66 family transposase [Bryobacterales bacterium]
MLPLDPDHLPKDIDLLHKIVVELCERLKHETSEKDKFRSLLRELLDAQRNRKSEQLTKDQLALFETMWEAGHPEAPESEQEAAPDAEGTGEEKQEPEKAQNKKRSGRQPLARHLVRERVVHDLTEAEKHCQCCGKDLHLLGEEASERYEFIPAVMKVIEDVRLKYACDCTVKTAEKPAQPIEKSTAGASVLAQVIVSKFADHLPLHRQERIFARHGVEISRKTMGGWMPPVAGLMAPLYEAAKKVLFESKVIGTDDTGVKVLDPKLSFARTGRIWPYVGDGHHPVVVYDYTATRGRDGPAKFLEGYTGYLQADAYSVYDAFFKPARGLTEVGCMMHMRRYFMKALDSDQGRMGPALHLIARLYAVENRAKGVSGEQRFQLRQRLAAPVMEKLHAYLLEIREQVLPKSPAARAVRYALNQWGALTRYLEDGDLEIDNGATERANRDIAIGRGNWTFFGSDTGGRTAAVLLSFIAMCKRSAVEPFAWFRDVLTRIATHPIHRIAELLPHNWKTLATDQQS